MMDERSRVIRDLVIRLEEVGIKPDRPFLADFIPGQGWTFSQDENHPNREPSSSSLREVQDDAIPKTYVRPQGR